MKKCRKCGEMKELSEYYKHKKMFDGHVNICKVCQKARISKHRQDNLERIQEYDRNRPNAQQRTVENRERMHNLTEEQKEIQINKPKREWGKRNRHKTRAHLQTGRKLINPGICSRCNSTKKIEGHHPDYNEPLNVIWLCDACHKAEHVRLRNEQRLPF